MSGEASAGFAALGLEPRLVETLTTLGYEEPTPIQEASIPPLLEGRDLVGQAATGTGKTAAFALPLLQRLEAGRSKARGPAALVLVPTRELAMQVAEAVHRYGRPLGVSVLPIYGGQSFTQQLRVLKRGVNVVVATPGRALDHLNRRTLDLGALQVVVLDEADEMLDMGFAEDLEAILAATPEDRQTVLFSATMPPRIAAIAERHLENPVQIRIARAQLPEGAVPLVRQTAYIVPRAHKLAALGRVLDMESPEAALVFCRTRNEVDELTEKMNAHGYRSEALHGGMTQEQRERVMKKLRSGTADLLIATDVAARGLDISRLSHVINYDVPNAPESYVHRIGRVGRAGREGVAITLAEPREHRFLKNIEQLTKRKIDISRVPTVADLRARRLALVRASLREALLAGELDGFRSVVESLAEEFDPMDIATAAVKLVQEATGAEVDEEGADIPEAAPPREKAGRRKGAPGKGKGTAARGEKAAPRRGAGRARGPRGGIARLFIGAGRGAGVRPRDVVGAITGEAGISGGEIGAIQIADDFTVVEVAEDVADEVLGALRGSGIKGNRVTVRRYREGKRGR
ncbi:MAG: DEAD/DEAH box helicase [Gemmatimonadetes bacterium]|nr:DEAD/DEAH box helicase [Gemmatimonadota bacterium]